MKSQQRILGIVLIALIYGCKPSIETKTIGSIERLDSAINNIITKDAKVEVIAEGFEWTEGPLWIEDQKMLLFSDIPKNTVFKWTEEKGIETYLLPSGHTTTEPIGGEPGSNGLLLDDNGTLVLCQHGDRRLARMNATVDVQKAEYQTIADKYQGKRFNSPNDAAFYNGDFYLTDPPYGLAADSLKEISFQGVYRIAKDGTVNLLVDSLTRPNGIAFSPDHTKIYVANSDSDKARWYKYNMITDGTGNAAISGGSIFYDATSLTSSVKGLPDGLKVDDNGTIFASGPGGVFIFNPEGKLLGKIKLDEACSNTALSPDGKVLYITNDMYLLRVKLRK